MNAMKMSGLHQRRTMSRKNLSRSVLGLTLGLALSVAPHLGFAADQAVAAEGAEISGSITENDAALQNVVVTAYVLDEDSGEYQFEQEAQTDADGNWTMSELTDGQYTLTFGTDFSNARFALGETLAGAATLEGEEPQFSVSDGQASESPFADVELSRLGGQVSLRLVDENGEPLNDLDDASAMVSGLTQAGSEWASARFWSDQDGTIVIPRVPAGGFVPRVSVGGSDFAPVDRGAVVTPEAEIEIGEFAVPAKAESEFSVSGELSISGVLKSGEKVTAGLPGFDPEAASTQLVWVADGAPISGAESDSLSITDEQVGSTLGVWAFAFAQGHEPVILFAGTEDAVVGATDPTAPTQAPGAEHPDNSGADGELPWTGPVGILILLLIALALVTAGAVLYRLRRSKLKA